MDKSNVLNNNQEIMLLEWSLNLRSDRNAQIPDWVFNALKVKKDGNSKMLPDIIFLNEVVENNSSCKKLINKIKEEGYYVKCSTNVYRNQEAIAINPKFEIQDIVKQIPHRCKEELPDMIHIKANYMNITYNIIGVRICIDNCSEEGFKERKKQFDIFKQYISGLKNVICAGDFNHARIIGKETTKFPQSQKLYDNDNEKYAQRFYNYQMIKFEIENELSNLKMITPHKNISSIGIWNDCIDEFTEPWSNKTNFKLDHIICSDNFSIDCNYSWNFYSKFNKGNVSYLEKGTRIYRNGDLVAQRNKNGSFKVYNNKIQHEIKKGVPDHAQLIATLNLK